MYDTYKSDPYLFNSQVASLIKNKDRDRILQLTTKKHQEEKSDNLSPAIKRDDLIAWNVIYAREVIESGTSKQYLHTLYNKYYKSIKSCHDLLALEQLEIDMIYSYFNILINYVEIKNNLIINKIIGYLYIHIENNLTISQISEDLHLSASYLSATFKKNMNVSIMNYYKKIKIERAKFLLKYTDKSLLEISTILCFCDQSNFTKTFKKIIGISPLNYRNSSLTIDNNNID